MMRTGRSSGQLAAAAPRHPRPAALTVGKMVGEDPDATRADETIGYLVIEAGTGVIETLPFVAGVGSDTVKGVTNSPSYDYSFTALTNVKTAVASQAGMDGGNGGWAVIYGEATPEDMTPGLTNSMIELAIDEDQAEDSERNHTTEQVAYFVIDPPLESAPQVADSLDTSGDGLLSPLDALLVIRWLNDSPSDSTPFEQLDTDRNGLITPRDALQVIEQLNNQIATGQAGATSRPPGRTTWTCCSPTTTTTRRKLPRSSVNYSAELNDANRDGQGSRHSPLCRRSERAFNEPALTF